MKTNSFILFAVLTLLRLHRTFGQGNVRYGDFSESPRSFSDETAVNYYHTQNFAPQKVSFEKTPDEYKIVKPVNRDKNYNDFLSHLYRLDDAKSRVRREVISEGPLGDHIRRKRVIVFRPLFVYKQQEVKRQRVSSQKSSKKRS
ncbi:CLUMA_CG003928, isoform A [Clunio marinus]|uniref:CLUMA_CG003928, isoform A n=1 Tax=Clunio marinus TaxID=568069 RepID=A0A1J1HUN3_9DIPT|nr:CLUMA_CG003928, isoform A [Clunio marinus]